MRYGWMSNIPDFLKVSDEEIVESLKSFIDERNPSQEVAWTRSIRVMQQQFKQLLDRDAAAAAYSLILEYELPMEGGRRPDAILLGTGFIAVLEFKDNEHPKPSDIDQVVAYARDLKNYHSESHETLLYPMIVPTRNESNPVSVDSARIVPPHYLADEIGFISRAHNEQQIDAKAWSEGEYEPLPTLIEAAYLLFNDQPLPQIKRANSANIPETLQHILETCNSASQTSTRHLVLLTGAPGAGKTLVGLQLAHTPELQGLSVESEKRRKGAPAVFLSGNGPLVNVLQDALRHKSGERAPLVKGIKKYLSYYLERESSIPSEHIIIFDEAQRAWSADLVKNKHKMDASEPELLLRIVERIPCWSVVLALIGEGQEIYQGEEGGIHQWVDALGKCNTGSWQIHCPPKLKDSFESSNLHCITSHLLNLNTSLRTHQADMVHEWVALLLDDPLSNMTTLKKKAREIILSGYPLYITDNLDFAKTYVRERYSNGDKRFGLLASRYAKGLQVLGMDNNLYYGQGSREKNLDYVKWFNAEPSDDLSCCSLKRPATEFECQGLELDFSILTWGTDYAFDGNRWNAKMRTNARILDIKAIRRNAYRVLMTRGRDGICVYVPTDHPTFSEELSKTKKLLIYAGMQELSKDEHS